MTLDATQLDRALRETGERLDRLEQESLDPDQSFEDARAIVESLRGAS